MDLEQYLRFLLGLVLVLGLIVLVAWLMRRYGLGRKARKGTKGRRLQVVESAVIDGRRRLLLLRRDEVEHLVMVGGPADLVIEPAIAPGATSQFKEPQR